MKYKVLFGNAVPTNVQCLKVRRDIPIGDVGLLTQVGGAENNSVGIGDDGISWDALLSQSDFYTDPQPAGGTDVFYPKIPLLFYHHGEKIPGYAVQWENENVTWNVTHVGGSYYLNLDVQEDIDHLSICRFFYSGAQTVLVPYQGTVDFGTSGGVLSATELQIQLVGNDFHDFADNYPFFDRGNNAIVVRFAARQSSGSTPTNWGFQTGNISKFTCEFGGESYDIEIDGTNNLTGGAIYSKPLNLPFPNNPAGAIRVTAVMTNGESYPWNQFLCQPMAILDSPDGIGNSPGNFVTARRSFGFTAPVTRVRWALGFNPAISQSQSGDGVIFIDDTTNTPEECRQSFIDQQMYFEISSLEKVHCTAQVMQGPFHASEKIYNPTIQSDDAAWAQFITGMTGIAVACDDTDNLTNYAGGQWPWFVNWENQTNYSTIDTKTELEKWLCPTCPAGKVLSGSCVFPFDEIYSPEWNGYVTKILEPICTINGTEFHNYSGWDATTTRDEKWLVLAYNRSLTRWEFHAGYGWEVINLMSIPWDGDEWLLATISYLIDGTIASIAWKVIYDTSQTPSVPSFEIWFKKSIDGGYTWSDAVKATTVTAPFLARVVQSPTTGIMSIGAGNDKVESTNGGESWS